MLGKAATLKRFEHSPLGSELKKRTSVAEKQYQGLHTFFKYDEKEEPSTIQKETTAITSKFKLINGRKFSFSDYLNIRKHSDLSFATKYDKLLSPFIID